MKKTIPNVADNILTIRLLYLLCTPFKEFPAYKAGVINDKGEYIVKPKDRTKEQNQSLSYLDRLIINIKKLINKLPGGESKLKNVIAGMILIKENYEIVETDILHESCVEYELDSDNSLLSELEKIYSELDNVREKQRNEILLLWNMKECVGVGAMAGGAPANNTSGIASYDTPLFGMVRRKRKIL